MNILVLHGPNMNLLGVRSARVGDQVTLDKIDTALRQTAKELGVTLKVTQTHYPGKAITFLQRNRTWSHGLLISPGPWARSNYDLLDTVKLVQIPLIEIFFTPDFDPDRYSENSLFKDIALSTIEGHPLKAYPSALAALHGYLSSTKGD